MKFKKLDIDANKLLRWISNSTSKNSKDGFFDICKKRGITGKQGVLIPIQNVKDLCLKDEVIEAVKKGQFHIYPIKNIDEGLEILTSNKAGKKNKNGSFTKDSVHFKAMKKLEHFYKSIK